MHVARYGFYIVILFNLQNIMIHSPFFLISPNIINIWYTATIWIFLILNLYLFFSRLYFLSFFFLSLCVISIDSILNHNACWCWNLRFSLSATKMSCLLIQLDYFCNTSPCLLDKIFWHEYNWKSWKARSSVVPLLSRVIKI